MDNKELELKIKEIIKEENFFDMVEKAYDFAKEYKQTQFYKNTKMPLQEVLAQARQFYFIDEVALAKVQQLINKLDVTKIEKMIVDIGDTFEKENKSILEQVDLFDVKNLLRELDNVELEDE